MSLVRKVGSGDGVGHRERDRVVPVIDVRAFRNGGGRVAEGGSSEGHGSVRRTWRNDSSIVPSRGVVPSRSLGRLGTVVVRVSSSLRIRVSWRVIGIAVFELRSVGTRLLLSELK